MKPTLGRLESGRALVLDVDRLIGTRALIQANSGAGKSWAIRRLLEQTHGQVQHIVLDVEGEFFTLREKLDYVLAGRDGGDCPAEVRGAELLARRLLELRVSAIIDLYELKADERYAFVRRFLEALVNAPKKLWHPVLIVIDEAHIFCPQKGSAESAAAVIDLMTRGRKRGFCGILATQRLSKLHKDAAAEANNKLIGRSALDVDMKRAAEELGFSTKQDQQGLRTLKPGEFFAFGPALSETVARMKVGDVRTTHPLAGQQAKPPAAPRAAVKRILAELADLPEQAAAEARSLAESLKRIRELERELAKAQRSAAPPDPEALERARVEGARHAEKQLNTIVAKVQRRDTVAVEALRRVGVDVEKALSALLDPLDVELSAAESHRTRDRVDSRTSANSSSPMRRKAGGKDRAGSVLGNTAARLTGSPSPSSNRDTVGDISRPQQRILDALAWLESVGIDGPDRTQLALWCDVSPTSGGYFNNLGALRSSGLLTYPAGGTVALTDDGRAVSQPPAAPPTVGEMQNRACAKVGNAKAKILRAVTAIYPEAISRDELAEMIDVSHTSGGYFNNLGSLRSLGLIDYPARGMVAAQPVLFLEA